MIKFLRRWLILFLIILTVPAFSQDFITREGSVLKFQGNEILLKGFSFGNRVWIDDPLPYQHHDEQDYEELEDLGMNAIRFYMNYLTLEDDTNPYVYKESGWEWIDQNIEWARKHNIFLILNMHVPQGGFQSQCDGNALWEEPENQRRLSALWKAIAEKYKDEPQIAGYDILNEPVPTESVEQWSLLSQEIIDSIRVVDQNHLIITERAIALDCDFTYNDGNYNYPDIEEQNLMYTVHLYDPFEFTHQNLSWANTGDGGKYPDENELTFPSDKEYATGHYTNPTLAAGTTDWTFYEGEPFHVTADSLIAGYVCFSAGSLGDGVAFYDDIRLSETDAEGNIIRDIYHQNLQPGSYWYWSENNDGTQGTTTAGHNSNFAITCTGTSAAATIIADGLSFKVEKNKYYKVSGWMRGENIPEGATAAIITEYHYSPSGQPVTSRNYDYLVQRIVDYTEYIRERNFPVYFGEFGVARNAFENDKGGELWVKDVLNIFDSLGFHFTYHAYREDAFGYYGGWDGPIDRTTRNTALEQVFRNHLTQAPTSVKQNNEILSELIFCPNPFAENLEVRNPGKAIAAIEIFDSTGLLIWKGSVQPQSQSLISNLADPGLYIARIKSGELEYSKKLIRY